LALIGPEQTTRFTGGFDFVYFLMEHRREKYFIELSSRENCRITKMKVV
jgi:hypothetical protein